MMISFTRYWLTRGRRGDTVDLGRMTVTLTAL